MRCARARNGAWEESTRAGRVGGRWRTTHWSAKDRAVQQPRRKKLTCTVFRESWHTACEYCCTGLRRADATGRARSPASMCAPRLPRPTHAASKTDCSKCTLLLDTLCCTLAVAGQSSDAHASRGGGRASTRNRAPRGRRGARRKRVVRCVGADAAAAQKPAAALPTCPRCCEGRKGGLFRPVWTVWGVWTVWSANRHCRHGSRSHSVGSRMVARQLMYGTRAL